VYEVIMFQANTNFLARLPFLTVWLTISSPMIFIGGTFFSQSHFLFFSRYAASPDNFEYMLDRMVGSHDDGVCDDIMQFSSCVSGNYWYFPSTQQLKLLAAS
jgi:hypothetical protein